METAPEELAPPPAPRGAAGFVRVALVLAIASMSAVLAVAADTAPTGEPTPDRVLAAVLGAGVVLAGSVAPWWLLAAAAVAAAVASPSPAHVVLGVVAVGASVPAAVLHRRIVVLGALSSAVIVQLALRLDLGSHGVSAVVAGLICAVVVIGGVAAGPPVVRIGVAGVVGLFAVVAIAGLGGTAIATLLAQEDVQQASDRTTEAFDLLAANRPAAAEASLEEATAALGRVESQVGGPWTAPARWVPVLAQHRAVAVRLVGETSDLTESAAGVAARLDPDRLQLSSGRIDPDAPAGLVEPLDDLVGAIADTQAALAGLRSPWLLGPVTSRLDRIDGRLDSAASDVTTARDAAELLPAMLGADGPRRYGVVFLNPARPTPLGGSLEGWFTLTAVDGQLVGEAIGPASDLEPAGSAPLVERTDEDAVLAVLADRIEAAAGQPVDGVILVDPYGLAGLLRLVGPVELPEVGALGPDEVAEHLLRSQYAEGGTEGTGATGVFVLSKVLASDLPAPDRTAEVMGPLVAAGRVRAFSRQADEQALLGRLGLASADSLDGDVLAVTVSDRADSRLGIYLDRSTTYRATVDPPSGAVDAELTVRITNRTPAGAPPLVLGAGAPPGTASLDVAVRTKLELARAELDGTLVPMASTPEGGLLRHHVEVAVPSGASVTLKLLLTGTVGDGPTYRLVVRPQPGATPERLDLTLLAAQGELRQVGDGPLGPGPDPGSLVFGGELREVFEVEVAEG